MERRIRRNLSHRTSYPAIDSKYQAILCSLFLLIALIFCFFCSLFAFPEKVSIARIEVHGLLRVSTNSVLNTLALDEGKTYAYSHVQQAIRRLYGTGLFENINLSISSGDSGDTLAISVEEIPPVASISISGNRKVGKSDIREKIALVVGSPCDRRLIHNSIRAIEELYKTRGYHLASVECETDTTQEGIQVIFRIDEGVKTKVGKIIFDGNKHLSDKRLRGVMETKERGWLTKKDFDPDVFSEDLNRIIAEYRNEGFINARILNHSLEIDSQKKLANARISIDEGPRTYIADAKVEIQKSDSSLVDIDPKALAEMIPIKRGQPFSQNRFEKSLEVLYSNLAENGFAYAEVTPSQRLNGDSISISFKIHPGKPVKVRKVIIEGNQTTYEKVIRREILIRPGDTLRRSLIERSQREIFNLRYFEDVSVATRVANEEGDIDLVFIVKERQSGIANIGAGYSEEFGLTGFIEFSHENVAMNRRFPFLGLGKGQTLNLRWEFGNLNQIDLSFRDPWFLDKPILIGFDIYDTKLKYDTYTDKRSGLGLVGGKRISIIDYTRLYLEYNLEKRDIRPVEDKASDFVKSQADKRTVSRVTLRAIRSSVDSPFFPRMGSRTSLELEWAGTILGGDAAYQSYIFDHRSFVGLPILKSALVFGLRTGVVDKLGSKGYVPIYERFRLGGTTLDGVRGYDDREIIPEGNTIDQGGRFMLINVLEWRVPVVENRAHVLAFFDAGNTWNSLRAARPSLLRKSVGIGFRIEIPMMGQLGIDVGYGFDREDKYGGPGWQTHFQFGMAGY